MPRTLIASLSALLLSGCLTTRAETMPVDPPPVEPPREPAVVADTPASPPAAQILCGEEDDFGPINVDGAQKMALYGAEVTRFSELETTKSHPAEVCGVSGELSFILALTCDDGTHPYEFAEQAHGARAGNVGAGGRCSKIIDLYEVSCPEATYEVHLDMYFCGPGEEFR